MHSVAHGERLSLDGRWRFQLLRTPNANPGPYWAEADVPSVWTMAGNSDLPHYTNVQMPFPGLPPEIPEANPTGVYEREFEVPADWAGRRVVLHVGAAESVLLVSVNGDEVGVGQGLTPGRRVRPDRRAYGPGANDAERLTRRQVVGRHVHRGPGPVVARRDHALGVPVRDATSIWPMSGSMPASPTT